MKFTLSGAVVPRHEHRMFQRTQSRLSSELHWDTEKPLTPWLTIIVRASVIAAAAGFLFASVLGFL